MGVGFIEVTSLDELAAASQPGLSTHFLLSN